MFKQFIILYNYNIFRDIILKYYQLYLIIFFPKTSYNLL